MVKLKARTGKILNIKGGENDSDKDKIHKRQCNRRHSKNSPAASKVIEKYFGNGCFTCPGMKVESISFGAMMHNVDPNKVLEELNTLED